MKRRVWRKLLSSALALATTLTIIMPSHAIDNGENVIFTLVDNDRVTASIVAAESEKAQEPEVLYSADEVVRVSIVLEDASVLERGYSAVNIAENKSAMSYRNRLLTKQNNLEYVIESELGEPLDVEWNLTLAANLISANVKYGQIEAIAMTEGVREVVVEEYYYPAVESDSAAVSPQMVLATEMTGMTNVFDSGYTGAGARIAIIDTGLDPDHQSFAEAGYIHALEENAAASGKTYEEYIAGLNVLDSLELGEKLSSTNAARKMVGLKLSDVMFSQKVPFGFNYVDSNLNISHDYDKQSDHGSHVAGIAAANRYIQKADGSFVDSAEDYKVVGNAPDAQLIVMKIFGVTGGGVDSDIVAACEDALLLGADSINMSLGTTKNGFSTSTVYQKIMETLQKSSGSILAVAAANDGHWADHTNTEAYLGSGYLYTEDVMYDRVAAPGSITNSLAVASIDNNGQISDAFFTVIGADGDYSATYSENLFNDMKSFTSLDVSADGKGTVYDFVFTDGVGYTGDLDHVDLQGKIAVISRGELAFYEKATYAAKLGAAATIIYNNTSGTINMDLTSYYGEAPCICVSKAVGERIKSMAEPQIDEENNLYYTGKLKVVSSLTVMDGTEDYTMSYFSSWGTTGDLALKPEITAPGGNIYSVRGDTTATDKYKTNSGTSMATPQIAGIVATFKEYLRESGFAAKFGNKYTERQLTQSLMMSTAIPVKDSEGNYYPVLQQGAGLANGAAMIGSTTVIMMNEDATASWADGKVKAELGDDPEKNGEYKFSFTLYNTASHNRTYELSAEMFTQDYFVDKANIDSKLTAYYTAKSTHKHESVASFTVDGKKMSGNQITVDGGDSAVITVDIKLDDSAKEWIDTYFPEGTYMQGFVFVDPQSYGDGIKEAAHSIPVLAFYGNWTDPSMFDAPSCYEGNIITNYSTPGTTDNSRMAYIESVYALSMENRANVPMYGVNYVTVAANGKASYAFGGNPLVKDEKYMPERDALSVGAVVDTWNFSAMRDIHHIEYGVRNLTTGEVLYQATKGQITGSYYSKSSGAWVVVQPYYRMNYTIPEQNDGDVLEIYLTALPEYYSEGKMGENSVSGHGATLKIQGPLDSSSPIVSKIVYNDDGTLSVTAADSHYIAGVVLYSSDGTEVISYTGAKQNIEKGESAVYTVDTAGSKENKYLLQVYDYAMNPATYYLEIDETEIIYSGNILAYNLEENVWVQLSKNSDTVLPITETIRQYTAATSNGDTIYAVAYGNELYKLSVKDPETPVFIAELNVVPVDLAYNSANGYLYAVTNDSKLVRIDVKNGTCLVMGNTPIKTNTLACDAEGVFYSNLYDTGKIYAYTLDSLKKGKLTYDFDGDGTLSEADSSALLDYVTGKRSEINNIGNADLDKDGDIDTYDVRLSLDKISGRVTLIADNGLRSKYMQAMEFDPNDGTLYWASYSTEYIGKTEIGFSVLYGFDVVTGEYIRYADVWDQMSCLLVLDKDAGNIYEPANMSAGIEGAEDKLYTGVTEQGGIAVNCGVDNSLKAKWLDSVVDMNTVSIEIPALSDTYNALYTLSYDPKLMEVKTTVGCGELSSFVVNNGKITFGTAGSTAVLAGNMLAEITFAVNSCDASVEILRVEENAAHPDISSTVDAGGHEWGEWEETPADCCTEGKRVRKCSECSETDTEIISADGVSHSWSGWLPITIASGKAPGLQERICGNCGTTERQWKISSNMTYTAIDVYSGKIIINEDYISTAQIYGAGVNKVWRLDTSKGNISYVVELTAATKPDAEVQILIAPIQTNGSGAGRAIRRNKGETIQWEDDELDYTAVLNGGAGSMAAYSYYNGSDYTELNIYFVVGEEKSETGLATYIPTPLKSSGTSDAYLNKLGVWEAEVTKFYWVSEEDAEQKVGNYDGYIWLAPELDDDFELNLEFVGANKMYLCDENGQQVGEDIAATGLTVKLENGSAIVKLVQPGKSSFYYTRYITLYLRNHANYAPTLRGGGSGSVNAVVGRSTFVDLDEFFEDFNGDKLSYTIAINGGDFVAVSNILEINPTTVEPIAMTIVANDGALDSDAAYVLTVKVVPAGDVNADGKVDVGDVDMLRQLLSGKTPEKAFDDAGDVNADGKISLADLILLGRYVAKWEGVVLGVSE